MSKPTDIRILEASYDFEEHPYRTPLKFGGVKTDHCVLFNVRLRAQTRDGKEAEGFGSMPLGNVWAFPPRHVPFASSLEAMKRLAAEAAETAAESNLCAHPLDHSEELRPEFERLAAQISAELQLETPMPDLCMLVTTSPVDAAIHDAFGKANGVNSYNALGREYAAHDLSRYLDDQFQGKYLDAYVHERPQPAMPLYHLVGALDPLTDADVSEPVGDGLPETLAEWIKADGLRHLKVKLNGDDLDWDAQRLLDVNRIASECRDGHWQYSADFNERCENVEYLLEFLRRVQESGGGAFERLAYIEQPTDRDLRANPENRVEKAAAIKPVVIDESLTDYETLLLARDQGYSGVALKACKGQSESLAIGAAAIEFGMFLAVQDLTCPGASFLHSAGLAARVKTVTAIEGNGRQYCPKANEGWEDRFPGLFHITDGTVKTGDLNGGGLGH